VHNLSKNMVKPFRSFVKEKGGYCQNFWQSIITYSNRLIT
jgi:hypothetical protein